MKKIELHVYEAGEIPTTNKTLVVGWNAIFPTAKVLEYNARERNYKLGTMTIGITHYVLLSDLCGPDGAAAIRERWNYRDKPDPKPKKK